MKRIKHFMIWLSVPLLLGACFSDEGNYEYESLKPPTWTRDFMSSPIQISVRERSALIGVNSTRCNAVGKCATNGATMEKSSVQT